MNSSDGEITSICTFLKRTISVANVFVVLYLIVQCFSCF